MGTKEHKAGNTIGTSATLNDLSSRKHVEEELLKKDKLLQAVAEAMNRLLTATDHNTGIQAALNILGEATMVDRVYIFENHIDPHTGETAVSQRFEWLRESVAAQIDNPDLQNIPYNSIGITLIAMAASFGGALERKRAEEALRLSEEHFAKAFNSSPTLMAISAAADGRLLSVNDRFLHFTGYSREEVVGRKTSELTIWASPDEPNEIRQTVLQQGSVHNLEVGFRSKCGEERVGLLSAELVYLSDQQCILTVVNDITERKQIEKEIDHLAQLNIIGEMAAGIGHEIRNPMTTVRGFLQMLGARKDCLQFKEYFELMIDELDRANSIITEYLSLAKNRTVDLKVQNLNLIVDALLPLIQSDALVSGKGVRVELDHIPDLLLDKKELHQLILKLVRNGLEATPPGGNVTIKTYKDDDDVVLSVQDQGKGIAPDLLGKIGTPFFTTKEQGPGLGLAICYSIASRHKATIKIATASTGTTVYVRFRLK